MLKISLIAAISQNRVLGKNNHLPWHLPDDLKRFKQLTLGHTVVMGRKTFESIGKALPQRRNIVMSRQANFIAHGCWVVASVSQVLELVQEWNETELFVIGGGEIYRKMLPIATHLYLTEVYTTVEGDTFFPFLGEEWKEIKRVSHFADERHLYSFDFVEYVNIKKKPACFMQV
ncbi:MAG: dihydrofolate reductase [Cytophagales bacterium]|nr:dihydrofolate reductase [Cytophagales bacterium]MDW8383865.1 dihydrofolate reductase [Flammeovirgaceae bacterium]